MGILDDAIREHLDLKRRQGADQEEIARLEDEAFGPPTRPGDQAAAGADGEQGAPESEAATATEVPAFHDQGAGEEPESLEGEFEAELAVGGSPAIAEESDADERVATSDDAGIPAEPTVEHDTLAEESPSEEIDLDIELQLDDEIDDAELELEDDEGGGSETGELAPPPASAGDEPIGSLDTVEHHFEDALDEADVVEDESEARPDADEDDDVLEETPEFLRDAPEDDELWFEQGEPKDFDF